MFRLRPSMRRRIAPRSIGTENLPDLAASHNRQSRVGCRLGVRLWRARNMGSGGAVGGRARAMEMDVALCERDFDPVLLEQLPRSEEHTSELQSLMRISYAVFCLKKKKKKHTTPSTQQYYRYIE